MDHSGQCCQDHTKHVRCFQSSSFRTESRQVLCPETLSSDESLILFSLTCSLRPSFFKRLTLAFRHYSISFLISYHWALFWHSQTLILLYRTSSKISLSFLRSEAIHYVLYNISMTVYKWQAFSKKLLNCMQMV